MDLLKINKNAFVFKSLFDFRIMTKQLWPYINPCCALPTRSFWSRLGSLMCLWSMLGHWSVWDGLSWNDCLSLCGLNPEFWPAGPALLLALCRPAGPGAPARMGKGRVRELHPGGRRGSKEEGRAPYCPLMADRICGCAAAWSFSWGSAFIIWRE